MYDCENLPVFGEPVGSEHALINYFNDCLDSYLAKTTVDRREFMCVLLYFLRVVICDQTPFDIEAQLFEVNNLHEYLKDCVLGRMP